MKKNCRLCLKNDNNCWWVFGLKYKNMYMFDIIYKTTSVEIHKHDAISQHICISCYNQVVNLYEFREKSLRNDKYLKEQYKKMLPKKTPHSSIIKIYQTYPGIKLPNTDLCLTEDISPMVVMELDRVENYFEQKHINMNKHVQCILKQEKLKEKTVSKNSAIHTKDNLIQTNTKNEQDKFNYKIIKNSGVQESNKLHNLQNHRKRLSTEETSFTSKKASMDPRVSPIVIRRKSESTNSTTTEIQKLVNCNIEQYVLNNKKILNTTEIKDNANKPTLSDNIQNKPCCSYETPLNNSKLKENQHKYSTPMNQNQFLKNLNIVETSSVASDRNSENVIEISMQISQCQEDKVPLKSSNSKTVLPITTPSTSEELSKKFGGKNVTKKRQNEHLRCRYCRYNFKTKEMYKTHIDCPIKKARETLGDVVVQKNKKLRCRYCRCIFKTKEIYETHIKDCSIKKARKISADVQENKSLRCGYCQCIFKTKETYETHIKDCPIKKSRENLVDVVQKHENLRCGYCRCPLTTKEIYETHIKNCLIKKANEISADVVAQQMDNNKENTSCKYCRQNFLTKERCDDHLTKCFVKKAKQIPVAVVVEKLDDNKELKEKYDKVLENTKIKELVKILDDNIPTPVRTVKTEKIVLNLKNVPDVDPQIKIKNCIISDINYSSKTLELLQKIISERQQHKQSQTDLSADNPLLINILKTIKPTPFSSSIHKDSPFYIIDNFQPYLELYKIPININYSKQLKTSLNLIDSSLVQKKRSNQHWDDLTPIGINGKNDRNENIQPNINMDLSKVVGVSTEDLRKILDNVSPTKESINPTDLSVDDKIKLVQNCNNKTSRVVPSEQDTPESTRSNTKTPKPSSEQPKFTLSYADLKELATNNDFFDEWSSTVDTFNLNLCSELEKALSSDNGICNSETNKTLPQTTSTVPSEQLSSIQPTLLTQGTERADDSVYKNYHSNTNIAPTIPSEQLSSNHYNVVDQRVDRAGDSVNNHSNTNSASTVPSEQLSSNQHNVVTQGIERACDSVNNQSNTISASTVPIRQLNSNQPIVVTQGIQRAGDSVINHCNTNIASIKQSSSNQFNEVTQGIKRAGDSVYRNNHSNTTMPSMQLTLNERSSMTPRIEKTIDSVYRYYPNTNITPKVPSVQLSSDQNNVVTQAVDSVHRHYHSNQSVIVPLTQTTSSGTIPYSQHIVNETSSSVTPPISIKPRNFANFSPPMFHIRNFGNVYSTANSQCIVNNPLYTSMIRTKPISSNTTDSQIWNRQQNQMGQMTSYAKPSIPNDNVQLIPRIRYFGNVNQVNTHTAIRNQNNQMLYYTPKTSGTAAPISYNTNKIQGAFRHPYNSLASRQNQILNSTVIKNTSLVRGSVPSDVSVQNFNRTQQESSRYTVGENISGSTPRSPDESIHSVSDSPTLLNSVSNTFHTQEVERSKSFNQIVPSSSELGNLTQVSIPDVDQVRYEEWFKNVNPNNEFFTPNLKSQISSFYQNTIEEFRISGKQQKPPISVKISSSPGSSEVHNQQNPIVSRSSSSLRVRPLTDLQ